MNELKPNGFETADALDRFRAVQRGQTYKILFPSDLDEAIVALEDKLNRRHAPENNPLEQLNEIKKFVIDEMNRRSLEQSLILQPILNRIYKMQKGSPENKPLTLEQLPELVGNAIWISGINQYGILGRKGVDADDDGNPIFRYVVGFAFGWEWLEDVLTSSRKAYARKPEQEAATC